MKSRPSAAVLVLAWLGLLMSCLPHRATAQATAFDVPFLGNVSLDGDGSDWGKDGFRVDAMAWQSPVPDPKDFDPRIRLAWDQGGLLLLATVKDDVAVEEEGFYQALGSDTVIISVSTYPAEDNTIVAMLQPGLDPKYGKAHTLVVGDGGAPRKAEYASSRTGDGYIIEARIPWDECLIQPREGLLVGCYLKASDSDSRESNDWPSKKSHCYWTPSQAGSGIQPQMNALRLSKKASPPVQMAAEITLDRRFRTKIKITAPLESAGRTARFRNGTKTLASARLALLLPDCGRSSAEIEIAAPPPGKALKNMEILVPGLSALPVNMPDIQAERAMALMYSAIQFNPPCFDTPDFPSCDFADPVRIEADILGRFDIKTRFYNAQFQLVEKAEKPGRYGAVVEITPGEGGRTLRRFRTVYRAPSSMTKGAQPKLAVSLPEKWAGVSPKVAEVLGEVLSDYASNEFTRSFHRDPPGTDQPHPAPLLAALDEVGSGTAQFVRGEIPYAADRQWWVTMKRKLYGLEAEHPHPFVCPRPIEGPPAPVLREGTLAEAGMNPDAADRLDALCREWSDKGSEGISVCVARHGVIVLHQGYGSVDGKPVTVDTPSWMASLTKLMAGTLMMMMVDQGQVDLDATVDTYLPSLRRISMRTPLTVRHLYSHTSGFWDHMGDNVNDLEELVAEYSLHLRVGEKVTYNGTGFALGSNIVEMISGEGLPQFYRRHLLDPLGCAHTRVIGSYGDAQSVPKDMARIGQMLLNRGAYGSMRFYSEKTFEKQLPIPLTDILHGPTRTQRGIGLIWTAEKELGPRTIGHGAASGAVFRVDPDNDLVVIMHPHTAGPKRAEFFPKFLRMIVEGIADAKPVTGIPSK
jgi:CubicO group peptidase (beta-lactamase class C family)